jgi:hypothetical protein
VLQRSINNECSFKSKTIITVILAVLCVALPGVVKAQKRIHTAFYEGTDYELNVYRVYGKEPGKTLMLIGGIQGDEPGGYLSVDHYADMSLIKGNLIVVPRANFQSIVLNRRKVNDDMNRKFADDSKSNYEAKIVKILKKLIAESDCLLNLHDGSGFFSEKWETPHRNPKKYGQSVIADCEIYTNPKTGQKLNLGDMARSVCKKINTNIKNPSYHFRFNNHRTREEDSLHKEQRKSATYYALNTHGIPAFGIETSKSLPLEQKVRHHNLAINAFMERLDIVPETPGLNLEPPVLRYLVVSINDSLPVVVKNQQSLFINTGDSLMVSHIEANYERGLSVDVGGYGTVNDIRKKIRIETPTNIIVRKDYYPCGRIQIKLRETGKKLIKGIAVSEEPAWDPDLFLYKIKINSGERIVRNFATVELVKGDKFEIVDVISGMPLPSQLMVNLKGFVGDPHNNTGEDRGYVIDTGKDLWQRYSLEKKGRKYQVVVSNGRDVVDKLFLNLKDPVLKYVVVQAGDNEMRCLVPGDTLRVNADTMLKLFDIHTNIQDNTDVKAFLAGPGFLRRPISIAQSMGLKQFQNAAADTKGCQYQIEIERNKLFLGSVTLNCMQENPRE